jgi:small GTP-binding protein
MDDASSPDISAFEVLTGSGPAAIAVLRVGGSRVPEFFARHVRTGTAQALRGRAGGDVFRAQLTDAGGATTDDILVAVRQAGPDWDVRLNLHGNPELINACRRWLVECGIQESPGAPAGLWAVGDELEAECYALLPRMLSLRGARWLVAQTDRLRTELKGLLEVSRLEEGRAGCRSLVGRRHVFDWFSRPARVAIIGPPNAGKSTLVNALAEQPISLTSPVAGTTRDWVDAPGLIHGFPVLWIDTAGLAPEAGGIAAEAARRSRQMVQSADVVVVVLDASVAGAGDWSEFTARHGSVQSACVVLNKSDLCGQNAEMPGRLPDGWDEISTWVSAAQSTGIERVYELVLRGLERDERLLDLPGSFSDRQCLLLSQASESADLGEYRTSIEHCLGKVRMR